MNIRATKRRTRGTTIPPLFLQPPCLSQLGFYYPHACRIFTQMSGFFFVGPENDICLPDLRPEPFGLQIRAKGKLANSRTTKQTELEGLSTTRPATDVLQSIGSLGEQCVFFTFVQYRFTIFIKKLVFQ